MRLRAFVAEDYIRIAAHAVEGDIKRFMNIREWANFLFANNFAYTVEQGEELVVCGGIRRLWRGTGVAWLEANLKMSRFARARALELFAEWTFDKMIREGEFRCVIAEARAEYGNPKLLTKLGFARLGRIPKYLPNGKDVILYVWNDERI